MSQQAVWTREQIAPLVYALQALEMVGASLDASGKPPIHAWIDVATAQEVRAALKYAREKGIIPHKT